MAKTKALLRCGVIGMGIGLAHAKAVQEMTGADLVGVCDSDPSQLALAGKILGDVRTFPHATSLLECGEIDVVVIASTDRDHGSQVLQAIQNELHVFVEKPLAVNRGELEGVEKALQEHPSVRLTTNTLLRKSPRFVWLKERIVNGDLGTIYHSEFDYLYGRLEKLTSGWRGNDPSYSVTLGGAIHLVDLLLWLVQERPIRVSAIGGSLGLMQDSVNHASEFAGDVLRIGLLEFASGMTAKVSANFANVSPHFHRVDVYGTEGTFMNLQAPVTSALKSEQNVEFDESGNTSALHFKSRRPQDLPETLFLPYPAVEKSVLLGDFIDSILAEGTPSVSHREALDAVRVCLAIDQSVQERIPIPLC